MPISRKNLYYLVDQESCEGRPRASIWWKPSWGRWTRSLLVEDVVHDQGGLEDVVQLEVGKGGIEDVVQPHGHPYLSNW